jgi:amino acid transporter
MADTKKLIWGIVGIIFAIGVGYYGVKFLNNQGGFLGWIIIVIGIIGAIMGIKELVQALK